jgi:hypothetical protein
MSGDGFESAIYRIVRISVVLAVFGTIATLILFGPRIALGFFAGAALSFVNLRWWTAVANAIGGSATTSQRASAVFLTLRYLLFGAIIYVIVKFLKITPAAPLAGLLATVAAVMIEALYELVRST